MKLLDTSYTYFPLNSGCFKTCPWSQKTRDQTDLTAFAAWFGRYKPIQRFRQGQEAKRSKFRGTNFCHLGLRSR
jgi:hypothetical protein